MKIFNKYNIFVLLLCLFVPLSVVGCKNSNKDSLSTPTISEVENGIIVFNQVPKAEFYTISINSNEINVDVAHSKYVEIIDNQIYYDASKIFIIGNSYTVKVRANSSKVAGGYSSAYSYKHIGTISEPENVRISETTLTWDVVKNANYYIIKVATPNDNIDMDDTESIQNANLPEFYYTTNKFNISSLLSSAGEYKLYVCAVLNNQSETLKSNYVKATYIHTLNLETPVIGNVYQDNDENFHINAVIDSNANEISVKFNNFEQHASLSNFETNIINKIDHLNTEIDNFYDINLSNMFRGYIESGELDVSLLKQFSVSVKALYKEGESLKLYKDSNYSTVSIYENTLKLPTPTINPIEQNGSGCLVSWSYDETEIEYVSEFNLIVFSSEGVKTYSLETQSNSMLITEDFDAIAIQAIGKGNYLSSNLSELVSVNTTSLSNLSVQTRYLSNSEEISISWNNYSSAYYILEYNNTFEKVNTNSYSLSVTNTNTKNVNIRVHVISNGYAPKSSNLITVAQEKKLETPTNLSFNNSKNLYELSFTGSENAIGYYIQVKGNQDFYLVNKLFTSTKIDLTNYICDKEVSTYFVRVQAVADANSKFVNSDYSSNKEVSHIQVLPAPEFHNRPIETKVVSGKTFYYLQFKEVADASAYELLINYNWQKFTKQTLINDGCYDNGYFKIDITNILISAKEYTIKIKAIPSDTAINYQASLFNTYTYNLTKQLSTVSEIQVVEHDGIHTLSFDPVDDAIEYEIRIAKENDGSYSTVLTTASTAINVTAEILQGGKYYFYITSIAKEGGNYTNSQESNAYIYEKRTTLKSPTSVEFENVNETEYYITWLGDDHADYYQIKITDTHSLEYEIIDSDGFKFDNQGNKRYSANISNFLTVQGTYSFTLYSRVTPNSENSKEYTTGDPSEETHVYQYEQVQDFLRYSVSMYGSEHNFMIRNINDLKNILWYHYLYEMNETFGLRILVQPNAQETLKNALIRMSIEATESNLYNFTGTNSKNNLINNNIDESTGDTNWYKLIKENSTETKLLKYLSQKLLGIYPEFNILEDFNIEQLNDTIYFKLTYKNGLNTHKLNADYNLIKNDADSKIAEIQETKTNYGKNFNYVSLYARKSANGMFNIDNKPEMLVSTTEQLLQAVEYGHKPKFVGDKNEIATVEKVYNNAKLVLSAIVTDSMTDIEKVTAIFNWLEYGFDLTYYDVVNGSENPSPYVSGTVEKDNASIYGKYKHYYLEGIFENITVDETTGNLVIGNTYATSWSYSKAFALLCGIEGIETITVNGNYEYYSTYKKATDNADHMWNKIKLYGNWYNVDLTFSDNKIIHNSYADSYGLSSHAYFLVSNYHMGRNIFSQRLSEDDRLNENIYTIKYKASDESHLINNDKNCVSNYDYYGTTWFGLTKQQIMDVTALYSEFSSNFTGFKYSLELNPNTGSYEDYDKEKDNYGRAQNYILNALIYSLHEKITNNLTNTIFEFKFKWENNGNNNTLNDSDVFTSAVNRINSSPFFEVSVGYKIQISSTEQITSNGETIVILCLNFVKQ